LAGPYPHNLHCHPTTESGTGEMTLSASARYTSAGLALSFRWSGNPDDLRIPLPQLPQVADGLWQHTCCEAFIAAVDSPKYREFNFSPSGQWAVYDFAAYRLRNEAFLAASNPSIRFNRLDDGFQLNAEIPQALLPPSRHLSLALCAVIESADGAKRYWALTHCARQPDFHLRQSFTLTLDHSYP